MSVLCRRRAIFILRHLANPQATAEYIAKSFAQGLHSAVVVKTPELGMYTTKHIQTAGE